MSNITENRLNMTILAADITIINGAIATIAGKLPAGSLNEDQRKDMLSMDVDNKVFAEDCMNEIGISGTGIIPPFITPVNIQNDLTLFEQLDVIEAALLNLLQKVSDLKRITADEAMTLANAIYKMYEMANLAGVSGAKQAYDKLKARYARNNANPTVDNP
jgi:hypothetical protein